MIRMHTWVAFVVSVLGLAACQNTHEQKASLHEQHESAETAVTEKTEAAAGAAQAKPATTLAAAIATVQKSMPDGRFMVARMENDDGKTTCNIVLASGEAQREFSVDTATGAILATENQELDPDGKEILTEFWSDPKLRTIEPLQAIEAALKELPGAWAVYAALSGDEGKPVYAIVVLDGNTAKVAQVSAADGKVQKVSLLEDEDEGEEGMQESKEKEEAPPAKPK